MLEINGGRLRVQICTAEGNGEMDRTTGAALSKTRGANAALALVRQLHVCDAVRDGCAEISRSFYEAPEPVHDLIALAVGDVGDPRYWNGGWDQLAAALSTIDRSFDANMGRPSDGLRQIVVSLGRHITASGPQTRTTVRTSG